MQPPYGLGALYRTYRGKTAMRADSAPGRRRFPKAFRLDLDAAPEATLIFVRRSDEHSNVHLLGRVFDLNAQWAHRRVRCEVDFTHHHIRLHALRRRHPDVQPLLHEVPYKRPHKPFKGSR